MATSKRKSFWRDREESSTFWRLLTSQHVSELRLIFFGTLLAVVAVSVSIAYLTNHVTYAALATKDVYTPLDTAKFIGAVIVAGATVMAWAYQAGGKRLGVVDLFACEIITLCRVGTVVGFVEGMIEQHKALGEPKKPTITAKPEDPARFNSEENYFPVFEANARDLQILEADVVKHVTEFYTYMKATRDMLRLLGEVRANHASVAVEDEAIVNVIYMVFLGYESARLAIDDLIEFEPTHAESKIVLLFTELRAFHFLQNFSATYKSTSDTAESLNQIRKKRLELRRDNYKEIVPELLRRVRSHAGEPKWLKAGTMVDGLQQLYDQYFPDPRPVSVLPTQPPPAANAA